MRDFKVASISKGFSIQKTVFRRLDLCSLWLISFEKKFRLGWNRGKTQVQRIRGRVVTVTWGTCALSYSALSSIVLHKLRDCINFVTSPFGDVTEFLRQLVERARGERLGTRLTYTFSKNVPGMKTSLNGTNKRASAYLHGSKPLISLVPITCTVYCYQG